MDPTDPTPVEDTDLAGCRPGRPGAERGQQTPVESSDPEPPDDPSIAEDGWLPV